MEQVGLWQGCSSSRPDFEVGEEVGEERQTAPHGPLQQEAASRAIQEKPLTALPALKARGRVASVLGPVSLRILHPAQPRSLEEKKMQKRIEHTLENEG